MIIGAIILRLVPHIPNFAPVTAMGLFSGVYLPKKFAIIIPLMSMIISDYLLGSIFHSTTFYVWGSFIISSLIGIWLRNHQSPKYIFLGSLIASLQFFLVTNFGVWAEGMYPRGIDGLMQSYVMGLPFLKWTISGDLFYTIVFFGSYALTIETNKKITYLKYKIIN